MESNNQPSACPYCGSKDIEQDYAEDWDCLNGECERSWTHSWLSEWGDENSNSLRRALSSRGANYPEYLPKLRSITINEGRCYFCNRSENDWRAIHTQIVDYLENEKASLGGESGARRKEIDDAVKSFQKTWTKVTSRHKVSTLMSDPHEFFPKEISKYWNEEWEGDQFSSKREGPFSEYFEGHETGVIDPAFDHPEWYSLERLCLEWLFSYHYSMGLGDHGKLDKKSYKDARISKIEKQMLKEITETFEATLDLGDSDMTADEKMIAEKMLLHRLSSLQGGHSGLRRFSWKPWSDDEILGESSRDYGGDDRSDRAVSGRAGRGRGDVVADASVEQ